MLAHENVLTRMTAAMGPQALPLPFWPTKTFAFRHAAMYLNGEGIQVIHMPAAHTDGDTIVFFRRADDCDGRHHRHDCWPVIDTKRGGTFQGMLDALNRLMDLSILNVPLQWNADRTFLVPGHGHVYDKLDLLEPRRGHGGPGSDPGSIDEEDARASESGESDARISEPVRNR